MNPDTYSRVMERAAMEAGDRAMARRDRMVAAAPVRSVEAADRVAGSILESMDRAASGVGEGLRTGAASRVTGELSARGVACAHALDRDQTGAIQGQRMRAKGDRSVPCGMDRPVRAPDACLARYQAARETACRDLRAWIVTFHRSHGSVRKDALNRINLILRTYAEDEVVRAHARALGWKV